jgi:FtsP/CotA-like multicopper oxidase with cupredoxin domain
VPVYLAPAFLIVKVDMAGRLGNPETARIQAGFVHKQMAKFIRESDIVKKAQHSSFKLKPIAVAIAIAMTSQFAANVAYAGSGYGSGLTTANTPVAVPTFYANSPVGPVPALDATGATTISAATGRPVMVDTGKALRKFVDTLPGMGAAKVNNLGQYIPVAVAEKWVDLNGVTTTDDYYEIAAVEFTEKMHSDLVKPTRLRGYVQLSTAKNPGLHIALTYPNGTPVLNAAGLQVYAHDKPHHLGPIINSTKGTAVRVKFTNYLPLGGELFVPVDTTITGANVGPDGVTPYTQNRAEIHLVCGQSPWISAGTPHQWVAPAGEAAAYAAGMGKGAAAQNVPDMAEPGNGSTTLYFPNDLSARFMFIQDRTSGLTRLNSYAGLEAGYLVTDAIEQTLINGGTIGAVNVAKGTIPSDQIPLIIEDKTFVSANIAQQDAKWDTNFWGKEGDLWFPHVYEPNQDPASINGANPVGRWDFGPLFWPIFPATAALPTGVHGDASFTPEAYMDTPLVNGTAYPTLTVDPKAYRLRILNASNDRYINLALYKADGTVQAPQLDRNGNPIVNALGVQQFFTNTEVKMVPAVADAAGNPPGWDPIAGVQLPLPKYPNLKTNINAEPSGPARAWPVDARAGGAPDPTMSGPDFIVIGNDGGLLPNPVDIPAQPITFEANRRSITVGNIYGYGMLLGPAERADAIVDFSAYAGQTLILYNDAPAPTPFADPRNDYYTGDVDQTSSGGAYTTLPGYGPNTRTMMQIKVNAAAPGVTPVAYDPTALLTVLPAAYGASQPMPIIPAVAYNAAFGTNDTDIYAHVSTGSLTQPTLDFSTSVGGVVTLTDLKLIASGVTATQGGAGAVVNGGSGSGYDPLNPPTVVFNNTVNGVSCLSAVGVTASATAVVDPATRQVTAITNFNGGSGYTCAPTVTFVSKVGVGAQASVVSSNFSSFPVLTKAEQELFDPSGRYNSTGGVELPMTNAVMQTTVPLNYIDSATEIIGDNEVQIWKLVDNGFWSNSIHFDMVDVQLINRVGWDGTVKAPATNEVGWKDTLRLNPLEDVVVAMRAKRPTIPFGLPKSSRLLDPSKPVGTTNATVPKASGMGFTVAVGITPALSASNVTADFDNEFAWNSAILSHSEDDFTRPVVYHPTVAIPAAPSNLTDSLGNGTLTWTDPTPAAVATTMANAQNEVGFKILQASLAADGITWTYTPFLINGVQATVPANTTSWTQPLPIVANSAFAVVAYNAAGDSAPSTPFADAIPVAPTTFTGVATAYNSVTLNWGGNSTNNSIQVWRDGVLLNTLPGTATSYVDATVTAVMTYNYTITVLNNLGTASAGPVPVTTPMIPVAMPTGLTATPNAAGTSVTVRWVDAANNETSYWVEVSSNGGATFAAPIVMNRTAAQKTAVNGTVTLTPNFVSTPGNVYVFRVTAVNVTGAATSTSASATVTADLSAPVAPAAPVVVLGVPTATRAPMSWAAVAGATSYVVQVSTNGGAFASLPQTTALTANPAIAAGNKYSFQVLAQTTKYGMTTQSLTASNVVVVDTRPAASTTPLAAAGAVGSKQITVSWTNASNNITGWTVQRRIGGIATTIIPTVTNVGTAYTFTDTAPAAGSYSYRVTAVSAVGTNGPTAYSTAVVAP